MRVQPVAEQPITGIAGCWARVRLTLTASNRPAPPASATNSRRFMSSMGNFLPCALSAPPTDRALGLPHAQPTAGRPASPWDRHEYARFWPEIAHFSVAG